MTTPSVVATNVSVERGKRQILSDVSLEVLPGEVLALVGPNGAGKSTLLATLAGEIAPAQGSVSILDRPSTSYRPKELARLRSVLLQSNEVSFPFRVSQIVQMGRNPWAGSDEEAEDEQRVAEAMSEAGVAHLAQRRFNELSGGERARVSLARVLAQHTELMLLDEPTVGVDPQSRNAIFEGVKAHVFRPLVLKFIILNHCRVSKAKVAFHITLCG
jgi:iron complex transport system ATP-binding protein